MGGVNGPEVSEKCLPLSTLQGHNLKVMNEPGPHQTPNHCSNLVIGLLSLQDHEKGLSVGLLSF